MSLTTRTLSQAALFASLLSVSAYADNSIIGGTDVTGDDPIASTTVGLYFSGFTGKAPGEGAICSGTILDEQTILTAAHCVIGPTKGAVVFKNAFSTATQSDIRPATAVHVLSRLSETAPMASEQEDIATVTFSGGLPAGYKAAQYLSKADLAKALKAGGTIVLAGYGVTSYDPNNNGASSPDSETAGTLRKVTTKVIKVGTDNLWLGTASGTACHGDSGGPAYLNYQGQTYVVGVTSRSTQADGGCASNAIYTQFSGLANVHTPAAATVATATPASKKPSAKKPSKPSKEAA